MLHLLKYKIVGVFAMAAMAMSLQTAFAAEPMTADRAQDTVAIQQLVIKYAHAYDALDVEGYVSVFAEDAKFTFTGTTLNGREDIKKFITGAKERKANTPAGTPVTKTYHSLSNTLIEFVSPTEAHHRSYWQLFSAPAGGPVTIGSVGVYDDVVVKRNGQWLIQKRNIPQ